MVDQMEDSGNGKSQTVEKIDEAIVPTQQRTTERKQPHIHCW